MKVQLSKRRLIPRWRRVASTLALPEGKSLSREPGAHSLSVEHSDLERAVIEWKEAPTAGHLGDVLAFSIAEDCLDQVREVARDARRRRVATQAQESLIQSLLDEEQTTEVDLSGNYSLCNPFVREQVRESRALLRVNPANPLVLLDFAQLQAAAGKTRHAERSLLSALTLSPNNRLVLRTLARFYVHSGRADRAHALLARHPLTEFDPWLMAGEIALSQAAEVGSKFAKIGAKIARQKRRTYINYTELAGAVGGLELAGGNWKRARELFRVALLSPNDNVIAQAITDQHKLLLDLSAPEQKRVALGASEARALLSWRSLDVISAETDALRWFAEEPFSSRPLQFLTALCGIQGQYQRLVSLARRGLIADSKDVVLLANLSYGLASLGRLEEAERIAAKAAWLDYRRVGPQTIATRGLAAMKRSDFDLADRLYAEAISEFDLQGRADMVSICYAYLARAALEADHPKAAEILKHALEAYERAPSIDGALILEQLHTVVDRPQLEEPTRRLAQWIYDKKTNTLVRKEGVTEPGAPTIVFGRAMPSRNGPETPRTKH